MPTIVNMHEAKTNLSKLVEAVEDGSESEIVIARNGKPVVRLVPMASHKRRPIGLYDGVYPDVSLEQFNAADAEVAGLLLGDADAATKPAAAKSRRSQR